MYHSDLYFDAVSVFHLTWFDISGLSVYCSYDLGYGRIVKCVCCDD